jgi:excisionase family DNA binding protein
MPDSCSLAISPSFATQSAQDAEMLQESSRTLENIRPSGSATIHIRIRSDDEPEQTIPIPLSALPVLAHVLAQLAHGNGVTLIPMHTELTTYEAARVLKVSRPFLIGLLDKGEIPHRRVGTHRRIRYDDLMAYKQDIERKRLKMLEELSALHQELGLD